MTWSSSRLRNVGLRDGGDAVDAIATPARGKQDKIVHDIWRLVMAKPVRKGPLLGFALSNQINQRSSIGEWWPPICMRNRSISQHETQVPCGNLQFEIRGYMYTCLLMDVLQLALFLPIIAPKSLICMSQNSLTCEAEGEISLVRH